MTRKSPRKAAPEEIFLEEVVRRVTGTQVDHIDDGSEDGMVDALVRYPDGRIAALEITSVADPKQREMESFDNVVWLPNTSYWWDLRYPNPLSRREIERHVPVLIEWMDRLEFDDVSELGRVLPHLFEWRWYERSGVQLTRYPGKPTTGALSIMPKVPNDAVDERLEGLCEWVESQLAESWWTTNVDKLARSGHSELHLAVVVHWTRMPMSLWEGLWNPTEIVTREPTGMAPLTDLWIATGLGETVTRWSARTGWSVTVYEPQPGPRAIRPWLPSTV